MGFTQYVQVFLSLATLLACLVAMNKFSQNAQKKRYKGTIKIVDRTALSSQVTLWVVDVQGQSYFIGTGAKDITLFERLPSSESPEASL